MNIVRDYYGLQDSLLLHTIGTGRKNCKPYEGCIITSWCFKTPQGENPGTSKFSEKNGYDLQYLQVVSVQLEKSVNHV